MTDLDSVLVGFMLKYLAETETLVKYRDRRIDNAMPHLSPKGLAFFLEVREKYEQIDYAVAKAKTARDAARIASAEMLLRAQP